MLARIKDQLRFATALWRFLDGTISPDQARINIEKQLAIREASFLDILERGVYGNEKSPHRRLLLHAGFQLEDVRKLVGELGLEGALNRLYDAGVYMTLEEVRGRAPVRRGSLEFWVGETDLDNPLRQAHFQGVSSGSRTAGKRVFIDFARLLHESSYVSLVAAAHGLLRRPIALWRPTPPDSTGLHAAFYYTKIGERVERWFSQSRFDIRQGWRQTLLLNVTMLISRLRRRPVPRPQYAPRSEAVRVARWLAMKNQQGTPAFVDTSASGATRVCLAAREHGLDISGTAFRVGGEPYTLAKAAVIASVGATALDRYALTELGIAALGCANPAQIDDMHVVTDKIAVIQRDKVVGATGETVPGLVYTTILASCPHLLLNTESGDYAEMVDRDCDCLLGDVGFKTHVIGLRSYDKLTSEGVTFMGSELYDLVEEVLPALYGGSATDYQLVEEEEAGLPKVSVIVSPEVGEIDEQALIGTVLATLDKYYHGGRLQADEWRHGNTLRVLRREPFASGSRKVLPLFVLRSPSKGEPPSSEIGAWFPKQDGS